MVAISDETLDFLGFSNIEEFAKNHEDIAELFENRPGYVYNFASFSWIDFIKNNPLNSHKCLLKIDEREIELLIKLKELKKIEGEGSFYCVELLAQEGMASKTPTEALSVNIDSAISETPKPQEYFEERIDREPVESLDIDLETPQEISQPQDISVANQETPIQTVLDDVQIHPESSDEAVFAPSIDIENTDEIYTDLLKIDEEEKAPKSEYDIDKVAGELGIDRSLIEELLNEFVEQAKELKEPIYDSIRTGNLKETHALIHKIKGAAANLRIKDASEILSPTAKEDSPLVLESIMDRFYLFLERFEKEIGGGSVTSLSTESSDADADLQPSVSFDPTEASKELGLEPESVLEFVKDYINQSREYKNLLQEHIQTHDLEELHNLIHKLKGGATNLRLKEGEDILDRALYSDDVSDISESMRRFWSYLELLERQIQSHGHAGSSKEPKRQEEKKIDLKTASAEIGLDFDTYIQFLRELIAQTEEHISAGTLDKERYKLSSVALNLRLEELAKLLESGTEEEIIEASKEIETTLQKVPQ